MRDKEDLKDYEGGYGGGRERVEQMHEHAFGERGWTNRGGDEPKPSDEAETELPEGVRPTSDPKWQEKFVRENADKYGQWGGKPIEQRGEAQSQGGEPEKQGGKPEKEDAGDVRERATERKPQVVR